MLSELYFIAYQISFIQKLIVMDYSQRVKFTQRMLYKQNENILVAKSDEVHFQLNGTFNRQNFRAGGKPWPFHEQILIFKLFKTDSLERHWEIWYHWSIFKKNETRNELHAPHILISFRLAEQELF